MSYEVGLNCAAEDDLAGLPKGVQRRIGERLALLAENPRPAGAQRLTGTLRGGLRLRIGDYRAGYEVDDRARVVVIWLIGHRSRFYDEALRRWPPSG